MGWKKKPQHGRVRRACDASGMDRSLHVTCEWQWHGLHRRTLLLADLKHAGGSIENSPRLGGLAAAGERGRPGGDELNWIVDM